jgi:Rrf2 family nitric oxide-sensitive transcriptional repressor
MRLTTMTDYSLRLIMYAGRHRDRLCTIAEIAHAHDISEAHLMKITHRLALGGWLETIRGKGGGLRLAREPNTVNLGELVRYIEPDFAIVECLGVGDTCMLTGNCRLTGVLVEALQAFMAKLDATTLADVIDPPPGTHGTPPATPITFAARQR